MKKNINSLLHRLIVIQIVFDRVELQIIWYYKVLVDQSVSSDLLDEDQSIVEEYVMRWVNTVVLV